MGGRPEPRPRRAGLQALRRALAARARARADSGRAGPHVDPGSDARRGRGGARRARTTLLAGAIRLPGRSPHHQARRIVERIQRHAGLGPGPHGAGSSHPGGCVPAGHRAAPGGASRAEHAPRSVWPRAAGSSRCSVTPRTRSAAASWRRTWSSSAGARPRGPRTRSCSLRFRSQIQNVLLTLEGIEDQVVSMAVSRSPAEPQQRLEELSADFAALRREFEALELTSGPGGAPGRGARCAERARGRGRPRSDRDGRRAARRRGRFDRRPRVADPHRRERPGPGRRGASRPHAGARPGQRAAQRLRRARRRRRRSPTLRATPR